ncbi:NEP1-interacting protein-like 1, partial [Primulina tabacum]|uniref:NEP1-interacting protein-like 1 n=1 Tax=Primulina tabacum TaxID=48773 RepID=UPI003F5918CE
RSCPCYAVGTILGAMTGALIGQETESGFVRGASVGAISGCCFSIEVFESSLLLWQSDESGIQCLLYLIDEVSLLSGRLVRERIGPAMLSAVQSQMGAVEQHLKTFPTFLTLAGANGLLVDTVEKFPKIRVARDDIVDTSGEGVSCWFAFRLEGIQKSLVKLQALVRGVIAEDKHA